MLVIAKKWRRLSTLDHTNGGFIPPGVWSCSKEEFNEFLLNRDGLTASEAMDLQQLQIWITELVESLTRYKPRLFYLGGPLASSFSDFKSGEISIECELSFAKALSEFRQRREFESRLSKMGNVVLPAKVPEYIKRIERNFRQLNSTGLLQAECYSCKISDFEKRQEVLDQLGENENPPRSVICVTL